MIDAKGNVYPPNCASNKVDNRKYNFFNFLPLFLLTMYKDLINLYFLAVLVITGYLDLRSSELMRELHRIGFCEGVSGWI